MFFNIFIANCRYCDLIINITFFLLSYEAIDIFLKQLIFKISTYWKENTKYFKFMSLTFLIGKKYFDHQ